MMSETTSLLSEILKVLNGVDAQKTHLLWVTFTNLTLFKYHNPVSICVSEILC